MLARIETTGCAMLLVSVGEETLKLVTTDMGGHEPAQGTLPKECEKGRCLFWGKETVLGPMVVAQVESSQSDMAQGAHLGVVHDKALRFIDLWAGAGEPVFGDHGDLGPAYSLEPWACNQNLALFISARLPAAKGTDPPEDLSARQGIYPPTGDWEPTATDSRNSCTKIEIELP